jgi:hypothetical protein
VKPVSLALVFAQDLLQALEARAPYGKTVTGTLQSMLPRMAEHYGDNVLQFIEEMLREGSDLRGEAEAFYLHRWSGDRAKVDLAKLDEVAELLEGGPLPPPILGSPTDELQVEEPRRFNAPTIGMLNALFAMIEPTLKKVAHGEAVQRAVGTDVMYKVWVSPEMRAQASAALDTMKLVAKQLNGPQLDVHCWCMITDNGMERITGSHHADHCPLYEPHPPF